MLIPRSLALPRPHLGRTLRHYSDRIGLRRLREATDAARRRWIAASGRRALAGGAREGRRYLTALPHQFCGIGHASSEWNTAWQWAPLLGLEHVNTPMREPWAAFLGYGAESRTWHDVIRTERPLIVRLPYVRWGGRPYAWRDLCTLVDGIRSSRNLLFVLADGQNSFDQTANGAQQREAFERYGRWRHLPEHREEGRLNIAVHIRRGDVAAMKARGEGNWRERYVEPDWFAGVMARVAEEHSGKRPLFHLYSQGSPEEFADLSRSFTVKLHLTDGEQECLLNMVRADVLILSPSGFSYLAGILSKGCKIARSPWWHHLPSDRDWTLLTK